MLVGVCTASVLRGKKLINVLVVRSVWGNPDKILNFGSNVGDVVTPDPCLSTPIYEDVT